MKDKQQLITELMERVEGYESTDKSAFISELLQLTDIYVLANVASKQGISTEEDEKLSPQEEFTAPASIEEYTYTLADLSRELNVPIDMFTREKAQAVANCFACNVELDDPLCFNDSEVETKRSLREELFGLQS